MLYSFEKSSKTSKWEEKYQKWRRYVNEQTYNEDLGPKAPLWDYTVCMLLSPFLDAKEVLEAMNALLEEINLVPRKWTLLEQHGIDHFKALVDSLNQNIELMDELHKGTYYFLSILALSGHNKNFIEHEKKRAKSEDDLHTTCPGLSYAAMKCWLYSRVASSKSATQKQEDLNTIKFNHAIDTLWASIFNPTPTHKKH